MKRRLLLITLALVITAMPVLATGEAESGADGGPSLSAPGEFPIVEEPVTVDIAVVLLQKFVTDMDTNDWWEYVESLTNVQVNWQTVPRSDLQSRRQLIVASGDYPDAAYGLEFNQGDVVRFGTDDVFLPLQDQIEEHAPNLASRLEERPDVRAAITAPDGNIYNMPKVNEAYHVTYANKMWIRPDWLEAVDREMPTTVEEYYETLGAFANDDPNGNGEADEIPLSGAEKGGWFTQVIGPYFMNPFVYTSNHAARLYLDDGEVKSAATQEGWREGLRFLNRLFEEGLLDEGALVQDKAQLVQLGENPGAPILGSVPAGYWAQFTEHGGASGRYAEYVEMPPLEGPAGRQATYSPQSPTGGFQVFAGAENPALLVKWCDVIYNEEHRRTAWYGEEGVGWAEADSTDTNAFGEQAAYRLLPVDGVDNYRFGWLGPFWATADIRNSEAANAENLDTMFDNIGYALQVITNRSYEPYGATEKSLVPVTMTPEDATEANAIQTQIADYINEMSARFVVGRSDLDRDWDAYLAEFDKLGLPRLVEINQKYQ
jgi:putative aldouronate transport system substrate-binding protein